MRPHFSRYRRLEATTITTDASVGRASSRDDPAAPGRVGNHGHVIQYHNRRSAGSARNAAAASAVTGHGGATGQVASALAIGGTIVRNCTVVNSNRAYVVDAAAITATSSLQEHPSRDVTGIPCTIAHDRALNDGENAAIEDAATVTRMCGRPRRKRHSHSTAIAGVAFLYGHAPQIENAFIQNSSPMTTVTRRVFVVGQHAIQGTPIR